MPSVGERWRGYGRGSRVVAPPLARFEGYFDRRADKKHRPPPDIVGAHNPHGDWTREKILPIVLGTLREMQFAEKDLEWSQWVVRDEYPLGIDFYPTKDHWGYFFPVFAETSAEEIASEVRTLAKNIFKLWEEEKPPLLGFERLMAERFPATYAMYRALTARS